MTRRNAIGCAVVAVSLALLLLYRHAMIEPRRWGAACDAATPPWPCAPRAALLWLQYQGLWGAAALVLGIWAFLDAPFPVRVAAAALGAAACVNYNATFGVLGAALGAWTWITDRSSGGPARINANKVQTTA